MTKQVVPAATCVTHVRPATPAERSFRVYMLDQYSAKHFALFLINQEVIFSTLKFGCEWVFSFDVPEDSASVVEHFLANTPCSRPSSDELVLPCLYPGADAGRLDLAQSQHAVAQVTGHGDTHYLADLWNAFVPVGKVDVGVIPPAPNPVLPESTSLDEAKLPASVRFAKQIA